LTSPLLAKNRLINVVDRVQQK